MVAEAIIRKIDTLFIQHDFGKIVKEFNSPDLRELKLFIGLKHLQSLKLLLYTIVRDY